MIPYLRLVERARATDDPAFETAFGDDIHWGYWPPDGHRTEAAHQLRRAGRRMTERLLADLGPLDGRVVLDVGCGYGGTLRSLGDHGRVGRIGVNVDEAQLRRAALTGEGGVGYVMADGCTLPVADSAVDVVLAIECVFHFASRAAFLREAARVVVPGGRIVLSDFLTVGPLRPAVAALSSLGRSNPLFGRTDVAATAESYAATALRLDLDLLACHDLTRATLPTYRCLDRICAANLTPRQRAALWTLYAASRLGALRYCQILLERPGLTH